MYKTIALSLNLQVSEYEQLINQLARVGIWVYRDLLGSLWLREMAFSLCMCLTWQKSTGFIGQDTNDYYLYI